MHFFTDKAKSPSVVLQSTFWNAIYQKLERYIFSWQCQEHNPYFQMSSNLPIKSLLFTHDLSQCFKTSQKRKFFLFWILSWPETLCHVLMINLEMHEINLNSIPTQLFWKAVFAMNPTPVQFQRHIVQVSNHPSFHKQLDKYSANSAGITELKLLDANSKR